MHTREDVRRLLEKLGGCDDQDETTNEPTESVERPDKGGETTGRHSSKEPSSEQTDEPGASTVSRDQHTLPAVVAKPLDKPLVAGSGRTAAPWSSSNPWNGQQPLTGRLTPLNASSAPNAKIAGQPRLSLPTYRRAVTALIVLIPATSNAAPIPGGSIARRRKAPADKIRVTHPPAPGRVVPEHVSGDATQAELARLAHELGVSERVVETYDTLVRAALTGV